MSDDTHTTEEILYRLDILYKKLDDMGWYVSANTVELAMEALKALKKHKDDQFQGWDGIPQADFLSD